MKAILFSTEMVRAILEGRKTVTRRVVKPQPRGLLVPTLPESCWPGYFAEEGTPRVVRPPYRPGEILYVRETWCWCYCWDCGMDTEEGCADETAEKFYNSQKGEWGCYGYKASFEEDEDPFGDGWHPSTHMPREAARIFLRVTGVRVERLQDITAEQIDAEGYKEYGYSVETGELMPSSPSFFKIGWNNTIKPSDRPRYGWDVNPWVWVIEFEQISKKEAEHADSTG